MVRPWALERAWIVAHDYSISKGTWKSEERYDTLSEALKVWNDIPEQEGNEPA